MRNIKKIIIVFLIITLTLQLMPIIVNAENVTVTREIVSNVGMRFTFKGLTLDETKEYEFGLKSTKAASIEKWHKITEYTTNSAVLNVNYTTSDLKKVIDVTDNGYITIRESDSEKTIIENYEVDLKMPLLRVSDHSSIKNGQELSTSNTINVFIRNADNSSAYYQYEKITDQDLINKYKKIKKENGDFTTLENSIASKPKTSNWKEFRYWNGYIGTTGHGYPESPISAPDSGLYYMWLYFSGNNIKDVYGCIFVDNLEDEVALEGISLPKTVEIEAGKTRKITLTYNPSTATNKFVTWTSSNEDVVTVDNAGNIIAKKEGSAIITVVSEDGNKKATCTVTVTNAKDSNSNNNNTNKDNSTDENLKTKLEIIKKASDIKYLENDQGYITKEIIDYNKDTGEISIELKISNTKKDKQQQDSYENTEIYLIVSENWVKYNEKFEKYKEYINTLLESIISNNTNTKIGIIGIKGTISDSELDENNKLVIGKNDEGEKKGTADDAEILIKPTEDISKIKEAINNMNPNKTEYNLNTQAAIRKAYENYSNNVNKILISLYDGVPDISIGVAANVQHGGIFSQYKTIEEAVIAKHKSIVKYTKAEILKLKEKNISFIQLRPKDTSYDQKWYSTKTGEKTLDFDGSPYVKELYGTIENPVYGKMYELDEKKMKEIITENIKNDVVNMIQQDIQNVKVIDYFPIEIINNFNFSYVNKPSIGTVSDKINENNRSIEWNIGTLNGNSTATLRYKLKIKNMKNKEILNKIIATNEKVVLTYTNTEGKQYTATLSNSPSIKLTEIKEENNDKTNNVADKNTDNTTAKNPIPQTGANYFVLAVIPIAMIIAIYLNKKKNEYKDIK